MKPIVICLVLLPGTLAACGGEGPRPPDNAMAVTVQASEGAVYDLRCRFRAVQLPGQGIGNSVNLSGRGPRTGYVPTDNARCTLKQTAGAGPVTVTIAAKSGPVAASVAGPGASATLDVL